MPFLVSPSKIPHSYPLGGGDAGHLDALLLRRHHAHVGPTGRFIGEISTHGTKQQKPKWKFFGGVKRLRTKKKEAMSVKNGKLVGGLVAHFWHFPIYWVSNHPN